jgi:hypothetical protein
MFTGAELAKCSDCHCIAFMVANSRNEQGRVGSRFPFNSMPFTFFYALLVPDSTLKFFIRYIFHNLLAAFKVVG